MPKKLTLLDFISRSRFIHEDKYDYSKSIFTRTADKITIMCRTHGEFSQKASHHLSGHGCPYCSNVKSFTKGKYIDNKDGSYSIPLSKNLFALIDQEDYGLIKDYSWQAKKGSSTFYAKTTIRVDGTNVNLYMHRVIMAVTDSKVLVDHINHNGLDNRRYNMRKATHLENAQNRAIHSLTSKYKGVCFANNKWVSYITVNKKRTHIGTFDNELDAAIAYDTQAKKHFKQFSNINIKD